MRRDDHVFLGGHLIQHDSTFVWVFWEFFGEFLVHLFLEAWAPGEHQFKETELSRTGEPTYFGDKNDAYNMSLHSNILNKIFHDSLIDCFGRFVPRHGIVVTHVPNITDSLHHVLSNHDGAGNESWINRCIDSSCRV